MTHHQPVVASPDSNCAFLQTADLTCLSKALTEVAALAPGRLTVGQVVFFLEAAIAHLMGNPSTFTDIRDKTGPEISKSIHSTYKIFLDRVPRRSRPAANGGLGWLYAELDPEDSRRKILRLTPAGLKIIESILESIPRKRASSLTKPRR